MIVRCHGPVSTRIDERRFGDGLLIDPLPSGDLHDFIAKTIREVEPRIGTLQPVLEVGNQVVRKEIPKTPFGQETERDIARIENRRVEFRPIGDTDERRARLAALVASLRKASPGRSVSR